MNENLLLKIKKEAKKILDKNTRFHCYAHAIEVLENVKKLIEVEGKEKIDKISLYTAALLHDTSNNQEIGLENKESAFIAEGLLKKIPDFPIDKISDVKRLIISLDGVKNPTRDELIIQTADEMAAFSVLGLIRSSMMHGKNKDSVKESIEEILNYIDKRYRKLKIESARPLVKKLYLKRRLELLKSLQLYKF